MSLEPRIIPHLAQEVLDSGQGDTGSCPGHDGDTAGQSVVVPAEQAATHPHKMLALWCLLLRGIVSYFNRKMHYKYVTYHMLWRAVAEWLGRRTRS